MGSARQIASAFGLVALLSLSGASAGVCRPGSSTTALTTTAIAESTTAATTDLTISGSSSTTVLITATSESSASKSTATTSTIASETISTTTNASESTSAASESTSTSESTATQSTAATTDPTSSESTTATGTTASETVSTTTSAPGSSQTFPVPNKFVIGFQGGGATDSSRLEGYPYGGDIEFLAVASSGGTLPFTLTPEGYLVTTSSEFVMAQKSNDDNHWVLWILGTPSTIDTNIYTPLVCRGVKAVNGVATALECTGSKPTYTRLQLCDPIDESRGDRFAYLGSSLQEGCLDSQFTLRQTN
ncbi:hypothetical protein ACHAPT_009538 [Fusarium lateritium]